MTTDVNELVVASHGDVYVGPVGTILPTGVDEVLDPAFYQLGLVSEAGVGLSVAPLVAEQRAWQSRQPVRMEFEDQAIVLAFELAQWNASNVIFAFGGGNVVEISPGEFRYQFLDQGDTLLEYALVFDWQDGEKQFRMVTPRGNVLDTAEVELRRGTLATLPVGFEALSTDGVNSPPYILTSEGEISLGMLGFGLLGEGELGA